MVVTNDHLLLEHPAPSERAPDSAPLLSVLKEHHGKYRVEYNPQGFEPNRFEGEGYSLRAALNMLLDQILLRSTSVEDQGMHLAWYQWLVNELLKQDNLEIEKVADDDPTLLFSAFLAGIEYPTFWVRKLPASKFEAAIADLVNLRSEGSSVRVAVNRLLKYVQNKIGQPAYELLLKARLERNIDGMKMIGVWSRGKPSGKSSGGVLYRGPEKKTPYTFVISHSSSTYHVKYRISEKVTFSGKGTNLGKAIDDLTAKLSGLGNDSKWRLDHQPRIDGLLVELFKRKNLRGLM